MSRILEVIASGAIGGGTTHVRSLLETLDPSFEPMVVSSPGGTLLADLANQGIPTKSLPFGGKFNLSILPALIETCRKEGVQVIHAHGTRAGLVSGLAASWLGIPMVYTVHGWSFHPRGVPWLERAAAGVESRICSLARKVICVSRADLKEGVERGILHPDQGLVIHNGIDPTRYEGGMASREACRQELGLAEGEIVISLFGRLTHQKGQRTLLRAAKQLVERMPSVVFLLVGDGEDRPQLENLVHELGIGRQVMFVGARMDVERLLAASDLCTLPSLWEGLPICLLEAMAARRPVVASAVNGNLEVVQHGKTGFLVPPEDSGALAEYLGWLVIDPTLRERFGETGHERVEKHFHLERMVHNTERVYQKLLGERA